MSVQGFNGFHQEDTEKLGYGSGTGMIMDFGQLVFEHGLAWIWQKFSVLACLMVGLA